MTIVFYEIIKAYTINRSLNILKSKSRLLQLFRNKKLKIQIMLKV